jgi:hypothetical protein
MCPFLILVRRFCRVQPESLAETSKAPNAPFEVFAEKRRDLSHNVRPHAPTSHCFGASKND